MKVSSRLFISFLGMAYISQFFRMDSFRVALKTPKKLTMGSQLSQCFLVGAHLVLDTQGVFTFLLLFFSPVLLTTCLLSLHQTPSPRQQVSWYAEKPRGGNGSCSSLSQFQKLLETQLPGTHYIAHTSTWLKVSNLFYNLPV